jgi:peptidoglycan/LPS O-acetylase OafA/YrhL
VTTTLARPSARTTPAAPVHRRDIEGLRAVAVLLVVLYHCGVPFLPGGYVGVDVFFVISGFLITGLLLRERERTGRISIRAFYGRRIRRLLPAALLVTVVTVGAAYRWLPPLRAPQVALDGLFTTVYGLNYRLAATGIDYLNADAAPSPLQHFWSLAVEEQFYLIWPLLLLFARRRPVLIAVVAASFAVSVWQTGANPTWAYFGLHTRAWELGAGALVAALGGRLPRTIAPVGVAAIGLAAMVYTDRTAFPGYAALLPVAGTVVVLLARSDGLLGARPVQVIGRLSYSWYLWHWPVLMIGPVVLGRHAGLGLNLALAAGALSAAAATYALVENPVRQMRVPVTAGLVVTLMVAGGCLAASRISPQRTSGYTAPLLTTLRPADLGRAVTAVPENLTPSLRRATADQPRIYRDKCSSDFTDASIHRPCAYGDLGSRTTIVLFGDSHAGAWFPAVEGVAQRRGWRLVVVTKSACSAASVRIFQAKLNRPFDECVRWRESTWDYIGSLHPAMVLMTSAAAGGDLADKPADPDAAWTAGWARSADRLATSGAKLYLLDDTPYQRGDVPECLSAHPAAPQQCAVGRAAALPNPARRAMIDAALRGRGVTTIDPTPWFCTTTGCPVIVGNVLVYRDVSHITATYARLLAPLLSPYLTP